MDLVSRVRGLRSGRGFGTEGFATWGWGFRLMASCFVLGAEELKLASLDSRVLIRFNLGFRV